jgi:Outer membrane protein/protective antigen OMA87
VNKKLAAYGFILIVTTSHTLADCQPWDARIPGIKTEIFRIDIDNQNVFDNRIQAENKTFHKLVNKLHIKTKRHIILRDILFKVGDSFNWRVLEETERKLRSKPYIKDAQVYPSLQCEEGVVIQVTTEDDWTLEPGLGFGTSGGKSKFSAELQEKNFLGLGKGLELKYKKGFVRNETSIRYEDPNLFGSTKQLNLRYQNNSDGDLKQLHLVNPFYTLKTRRAWGIDMSDWTLINPIYQRGQIVDEIGQNRQQMTVNTGWLLKNKQRKYHRLRIGLTTDHNTFFNSEDFLQSTLPDDRNYTYPWIGYELIQEDFIERTNFNGMGRTEDVALGHHLTIKLGRDFSLTNTFFELNYQKGYTPNKRHLLTFNTFLTGIHDSDEFVNTHVGFKTECGIL